MSGEGECLYYYVRTELATIQREQEWLAEQQAKLEAAREALLERCGWVRRMVGDKTMWSRGPMRLTTNEALTAVREAYEIMTGPKESAVKPDDCPGDLS